MMYETRWSWGQCDMWFQSIFVRFSKAFTVEKIVLTNSNNNIFPFLSLNSIQKSLYIRSKPKSNQSELCSFVSLVLRFVQMSNSYCPRIWIVLNKIQERNFTFINAAMRRIQEIILSLCYFFCLEYFCDFVWPIK